MCLRRIKKKGEKCPAINCHPTPTYTVSLGSGEAVAQMTQRWRFFFSTKLHKWREVPFTGMYVCASVSRCTLCVSFYGVVLVFFHTHPALRPEALLTRTSVVTFLEVASNPPPTAHPAVDVFP